MPNAEFNAISLFGPLLATFIVSILPIAVLFFLPSVISFPNNKRRTQIGASFWTSGVTLNLLLCFAAGSLIGDAILHLLVEGMFGGFPSKENADQQAFYVIIGVGVFFAIDVIMRNLCQEDSSNNFSSDGELELEPPSLLSPTSPKNGAVRHRKPSTKQSPDLKMLSTGRISPPPTLEDSSIRPGQGLLNLVADALHNFTDGLALAAAFGRGTKLGITTTIAIFFHEIPHELGDYAILYKSGYKHKKIIILQLLTGAGSFLGVIFGLTIQDGHIPYVGWIDHNSFLPFSAGGFLYVAFCSILSDVLNDRSCPRTLKYCFLQIFTFALGVFLMMIMS